VDDISAPIHRSLIRPQLLLGGERELVLMLAVIAGIFILMLFSWWAFFTGLALWVVGIFFLVRAAKHDPVLSTTFIRHLAYRRFYPAAATPFASFRTWKYKQKV